VLSGGFVIPSLIRMVIKIAFWGKNAEKNSRVFSLLKKLLVVVVVVVDERG
jgi:hypothetical protein